KHLGKSYFTAKGKYQQQCKQPNHFEYPHKNIPSKMSAMIEIERMFAKHFLNELGIDNNKSPHSVNENGLH
ncbi:MAG: hypothetical protein RL563_506, partial [Pseudomonadota bacterium]